MNFSGIKNNNNSNANSSSINTNSFLRNNNNNPQNVNNNTNNLGNLQNRLKSNKFSYINEIMSSYYRGSCEHPEQFPEIVAFNELIKENASLRQLFELVIDNQQNHSYFGAIFFADKLLTLIEQQECLPVIVYLLGECFFYNQDYKKVHSLFVKHKLVDYNQSFQILAGRSLFYNKSYDLCLNILEQPVEKSYNNQKIEAQKFLLQAQCNEANENKIGAIENYRQCLKKDPTCQEAFTRLIDCYLMKSSEKNQLLAYLNFNSEDIWIKRYYEARITNELSMDFTKSPQKGLDIQQNSLQQNTIKSNLLSPYSQSVTQQLSTPQRNIITYKGSSNKMQEEAQDKQINNENLFDILTEKENIDILCIKAKNAHQSYDVQQAYDICVKAIKKDPLYFDIIPIYCACLLDLNYIGELYYCAHNLIENYSNHPLSWFAIGTYYFLTKKYEIARKYFQKAIQIDRNFIYAWIGMAHSFAIQDESDQAMSVYRTVSRLFPGCYQAHIYMGMEYLRTNNLKTAKLSFNAAQDINSQDPLIFNEIGVIYFKEKHYKEAKENYEQAIEICKKQDSLDAIMETILSNLAHTYRKLKDWKNAIQTYEQCITINPKNSQTYFSLGYTYHIHNQLSKAISYYHKSLHFKQDNAFAQEMLSKCLHDATELQFEAVFKV